MADLPLLRSGSRSALRLAERPAVRTYAWPLAIIAIAVLGGVLRFRGLDWDRPPGAETPLGLHPDERFLSIVAERIQWPGSPGEYFDTSKSPLNPYNAEETPSFVYGTVPFFVTKAVATAAEHDTPLVSPAARAFCERDAYGVTVMCGRRLTALVDTLTVLLVIVAGTLLFGRVAGLVAGSFYALAVLPIQLSHFWTVDPWVVFFGTATLVLSVLWIRSGMRPERPAEGAFMMEELAGGGRAPHDELRRRERFALAFIVAGLGLAVGLGLASKVTAWPLLLAPLLAVATRIGLRDLPVLGLRWKGERPPLAGHWTLDFSLLCVVFLLALVVFRIGQPYAFLGPSPIDMTANKQWVDDIRREINYQDGNVNTPPFIQFAGRTPLVWPLLNTAMWGFGPLPFLAGAAGGVLAGIRLFRRRELTPLLLLAVCLAVVGFQGLRFVAYLRYFVPMYPALCLLAAYGLRELARTSWLDVAARLPGRITRPVHGALDGPWPARVALGLAGLVVASAAWWSLAFQEVYSAEHPRIAASRWIYENLPPGTVITAEYWDDDIPVPMPGTDYTLYPRAFTAPFDTDSVAKVKALIYGQSQVEPKTPGLQGADYVAITSNRVRSAVPRLEREYPATIRYYELLDSGELGFELVKVFRTQPTFLGLSVDDSSAEESFTVYDHPVVRLYKKTERWDASRAEQLLLAAHPERAVDLIPRQGRTNGLQFTAADARTQQEGGTFDELFSRNGFTSHAPWLWWFLWMQVLAVASVPWATWLLRALPDRGYGLSKLLGFAGAGFVTWLIVAWDVTTFSSGLAWAVFGAWLAAGYGIGFLRRHALSEDVQAHWRSWLAAELLFVAAFGAVVALRYANPDLWHHPQGGEKPVELAFLSAVSRSTILPPYDPWFAGGTMNYYYMGWFMVSVPMRALRIPPEVGFNLGLATYAGLVAATAYTAVSSLVGLTARVRQRSTPSRGGSIAAGIFGVAILLALGNLDSGQQAIQRLQAINTWELWQGRPFLGGLVGVVGGLWRWVTGGGPLPPFDWWRASRAHAPAFDITEFPLWSFVFGDLHAHVMGLPFFGAVVVLGIALVATAVAGDRLRTWVLAGLLGVAVGLVRTVHTWDFPTATIMGVAAIAAAQLLRKGRWQDRTWDGIGQVALFGVLLTVLFAPYTRHTEVFERGLIRSLETTKANQYFAHFGLFVVVLTGFLAVRYHEVMRSRGGRPGHNPFLILVAGWWEVGSLVVFLLGLSAFTWQWGLTTIALSAVVLLFLGNLLWLEIRDPAPDAARFLATGLFFGAVGIASGIDIVQVKFDIVRMNTVFKFSLQAWQLYAIASAYAAWYVATYLFAVVEWQIRPLPRRGIASFAFGTSLAIVLAGAALYPWSGIRARQEARFAGAPGGTLDGLAYLQAPGARFVEDKGTQPTEDDRVLLLRDDEPIIRWLRENVEGSPVVVEAVGPLYHWTGRISWNTGLPAVIGWDWHEIAYRTGYAGQVDERRRDTQRFYTDPGTEFARQYLRKYNVRYVVVGGAEHAFGTPAGIEKFGFMADLVPVFREGDSVIYRVEGD